MRFEPTKPEAPVTSTERGIWLLLYNSWTTVVDSRMSLPGLPGGYAPETHVTSAVTFTDANATFRTVPLGIVHPSAKVRQ